MKPHRTKIESANMINAIMEFAATTDIEPKRIAADLEVSVTYVHNQLRELGYRQMLVGPEERRAIIASRLAKKPIIKSA